MADHSAARADRGAGVLLGQACGDALGVPYEFARQPGTSELAEMRGGGLGPYAPGEWSDDTQMSVCIARVTSTGADLTNNDALDAIADGFLDWAAHGATDIGNQTRAVLTAGQRGDGRTSIRLRDAARAYGSRHSRSAGNGALMRTSVVGLTSLADRDRTAEAARAVAELTHADPLAGDSCVLWSEAVRVAVQEARFSVAEGLDLLPEQRRDQWSGWITDAERKLSATFRPNGFTVTALQAAWSSIVSTPIPRLEPENASYPCLHLQEALHAAVRIGDDTDTVAAIAGGLLGACWGSSAVPARWRRVIHGWPRLRARDLVTMSVLTARGGRPDSSGWPTGATMEYGQHSRASAAHPYDGEVLLGTATPTGPKPTAVVSLCRMGCDEPLVRGVPSGDWLEAWLIDCDDVRANPNLDFVLADTAQMVADLRAEGKHVLVHCVAAEQRTPSVAVAYARQLGITAPEAQQAVRRALPSARARGRLWEQAALVAPAE
ncbi:MAG: ADP-ribosylglycohydrolase family protein [Nocardioidaceae bacterium]|nr:ADP-ribosylglycohydrolase family protein [Nocardioidaceae bacterium]